MTEAERLSSFADVPIELAEFVVTRAHEMQFCLRDIRSDCRRQELVQARWQIAAEARAHRFGSTPVPLFTHWEIARALNRERTTVLHGLRKLSA